MIDFNCMEPIEFVKNEKVGRSMVSFLDRSCGKFVVGLFHESEPVNILAKLLQYTYYGYCTYLSHYIDSVEELKELFELYKKNVNESDFWWEDDTGIPYGEDVIKLAEFLNGEFEEDEELEDWFLEEMKEKYTEEPSKPVFKLIKNEENNEEDV